MRTEKHRVKDYLQGIAALFLWKLPLVLVFLLLSRVLDNLLLEIRFKLGLKHDIGAF
jgi:hypothetical protein